MKFMVMCPGSSGVATIDAESARRTAKVIREYLEHGVIEACYAFVAGGVAFVVQAESQYELIHMLRESPLIDVSHAVIHELYDMPCHPDRQVEDHRTFAQASMAEYRRETASVM
jgi:hypothetical protein